MVTIRRATPADLGLLAELNQDVQRLHAEAMPDTYKPVSDLTPIIDDFENRVLANPDGWVYIAEIDGEAMGYACALRVQRPANPYTHTLDYLLVDQVSVKPAYQGMGYGRALMEAIFDLARAEGLSRLRLTVMAFNTNAIDFYARLGFEMFSYQMTIDLEKVKG